VFKADNINNKQYRESVLECLESLREGKIIAKIDKDNYNDNTNNNRKNPLISDPS